MTVHESVYFYFLINFYEHNRVNLKMFCELKFQAFAHRECSCDYTSTYNIEPLSPFCSFFVILNHDRVRQTLFLFLHSLFSHSNIAYFSIEFSILVLCSFKVSQSKSIYERLNCLLTILMKHIHTKMMFKTQKNLLF